MRGLGQHTLLGIVVGYARFWAAHFTGHHFKSDVGRLHQWVQNNPFFKNIRKVEVCRHLLAIYFQARKVGQGHKILVGHISRTI
jgi:hypothetical protein